MGGSTGELVPGLFVTHGNGHGSGCRLARLRDERRRVFPELLDDQHEHVGKA